MSTAFALPPPQAPLPRAVSRAARHGFNAPQRRVIHLLAQGVSVTKAAEETGVHRTTINHWQRSNPLFLLELEQARQEISAKLRDQYLSLAPLAMEALRDLLANPKTPSATRLKAITLVLNAAMAEVDPAHLQPSVEAAIHQNSSLSTEEQPPPSGIDTTAAETPGLIDIHQNSSRRQDSGYAAGNLSPTPERAGAPLEQFFAEMDASLTAHGIFDPKELADIHRNSSQCPVLPAPERP